MAYLIQKARNFAIEAHKNQRYENKHYQYHLESVCYLVEKYGEIAKVVSWLHDVIEDTEKTYDDIFREFGEFIADLVSMVSDEIGFSRRERKLASNLKLARCSDYYKIALIVKAADRLTNMERSIRDNKINLIRMYYSEYTSFKLAVYRPNLCDDLWRALDVLYEESIYIVEHERG